MQAASAMTDASIIAHEAADPDYPLLKRVASGERDALDELLRRHAVIMWKIAMRFCDGHVTDAEDVMQEACLACLAAAPKYAKRGSVKSWLIAITANTARRLSQAAQRRRHHEARSAQQNEPPQELDDGQRMREAANSCLTELRRPLREILSLRYLDELDDATIAATLGVSEVTVRTRCHRALEYLRKALARRGFSVSTAGLMGILVPTHAMAIPSGVAQLISTTCATGNIQAISAGSFFVTGTSWFVAKIAIGISAVIALAVAGVVLRSSPREAPVNLREISHAVVASEPTPEPTPIAANQILDQRVTLNLNAVQLEYAIKSLRILLPLEQRPRFVVGSAFRATRHSLEYDMDSRMREDFERKPKKPQEENLSYMSVSLAVENETLTNVLNTICAQSSLRWHLANGTVFIDKPLPAAELAALEKSYNDTGVESDALALGYSSDAFAMRVLLLSLAHEKHGIVAAKVINEWINGNAGESAKIARFFDDQLVLRAVGIGIKNGLLSDFSRIYLGGQLRIPGQVDGCLSIVKTIKKTDKNTKEETLFDRQCAAIKALGWSDDESVVQPLSDIINNTEYSYVLRGLAIEALGNLRKKSAVDALLAFLARNPGMANLVSLALSDAHDSRIIPALRPYLEYRPEDNSWLRAEVARGIGMRGNKEALNALRSAYFNMGDVRFYPAYATFMDAILMHEGEFVDKFIIDVYSRQGFDPERHLGNLPEYVEERKGKTTFSLIERILELRTLDIKAYPFLVKSLVELDRERAERLLMSTLPERNDRLFPVYCQVLPTLSDRANKVIFDLADDSDPRMRKLAASLLFNIGKDGQERLHRLCLQDTDDAVCRAAHKSILAENIDSPVDEQRIPSRWSVDQWKELLAHRLEEIGNATKKHIISKSYRFTKDDWVVMTKHFLGKPDDVIVKWFQDDEETLLKLYSYSSETWQLAVSILVGQSDERKRFILLGDRMQETFFCWGKFNVIKLKADDQAFLFEVLAKSVESDQSPKVRARAGWTLGLCLSDQESRNLATYDMIRKRLEACSRNDVDKRVCDLLKKCLDFPSRTQDEITDGLLDKKTYRFVWPKDKEPVEKPNPAAANDF